MAKIIRTVTGDIMPDELGITLPHEHLITFPPVRTRSDSDYRLDSIEKAIEEVKMYKKAGGNALGELTGGGYGRDLQALKKISEATGVKIIGTAGYIMENLFPDEVYNLTAGELADLLVSEICDGVEGVKTGILKCGTSHDKMTKAEEKVMRAVCRAHHETGVPISTHTTDGTMAFAQIDLFKEEKVDLSRVTIGHLDRRSLGFDYIKMIAGTGVYVELDNIGKTKYYSDDLRIEVIKRLIDEGYVKHILLSDDNGRKSYFKSYGGGPGLENILTDFVPRMKAAGIKEKDINTMLIDNPKTFLAF